MPDPADMPGDKRPAPTDEPTDLVLLKKYIRFVEAEGGTDHLAGRDRDEKFFSIEEWAMLRSLSDAIAP